MDNTGFPNPISEASRRSIDQSIVSQDYFTSKLFSLVNEKTLIADICFTNHQDQIFIMAPKTAVLRTDLPFVVDMAIESYVCMASLPADLQAHIRAHFAAKLEPCDRCKAKVPGPTHSEAKDESGATLSVCQTCAGELKEIERQRDSKEYERHMSLQSPARKR